MELKKLSSSLLFRVVLAIIAGVVCSFFFPEWLARIFATFNGLFGNFLSFFVPVLIFALITPAIAGLGRGAGKWLGITTGVAYVSTIVSGIIAYLLSLAVYPTLLGGENLSTAVDVDEGALQPYFSVEMEPPLQVMSALLLAFAVGLSMTVVKSDTLFEGSKDLQRVVMKVIENFVVPLLPVFIFGMFLGLGMNGNFTYTLMTFGKVLILATVMTVLYIIVQYLLAGSIAGVNPFRALKTMLPAYATALGTSSSAATIPVTYKCARRNGVEANVAGFVVPLCATIHLAGSMMKIGLFAFSIMYMTGTAISPGLAIGFIMMLGVTMIAAPGVPGGAIMAAVGLLQSMLGFDGDQVALMIAAYIAIDSFGTAANVTGDGAIALIINRFAKDSMPESQAAEEAGLKG